MGTKERPGPIDCYAAAAPDEPIFVLRATDLSAPGVVEFWAYRYRERKLAANEWDVDARAKHGEAMKCAREMRAYYRENRPL